mmetsp:Transcript_9313/g.21520  ORF Transcript_9313/g.21520 Transcript_9313/m.21520 type:complete len:363 (-) Transcript_9313:259-1347(-)
MAREMFLSNTPGRCVLVRYFLDGPGYNLENSSSIFWHDAPAMCSGYDIETFLHEHGLLTDGLIAQVYLEKFKTFMSLRGARDIHFDYKNTSSQDPGRLDVRLTRVDDDLPGGGSRSLLPAQITTRNTNANMSPLGLFGFSMVTGLHSTLLLGELTEWNAVEEGFKPKFSFYAFFIGGLVQFIAGLWETRRGNLYGGTAFTTFGCFWLANGAQAIFADVIGLPDPSLGSYPVGAMVVELYTLFFSFGLFCQTFASTALSTIITIILQIMLAFAAFEGFNDGIKWTRCIVQYVLSAAGFYGYFAELTNEIYNHEYLPVLPWNCVRGEEDNQGTFEGAGKNKHLTPTRVTLRDPLAFAEMSDQSE